MNSADYGMDIRLGGDCQHLVSLLLEELVS